MINNPDKQGDPESLTCRHCRAPRQRVNGYLFCGICDAGHVGQAAIRPTWMKKEES